MLLGLVREQPCDESSAGKNEHQVWPIAVSNDVRGAVNCLICAAACRCTELGDHFVESWISGGRNFYDFPRNEVSGSTRSLADATGYVAVAGGT